MYPMEISTTTKLITETCLAIKEGDSVLIAAYDDENVRIASALAASIKAAGGEAAIVVLDPGKKVEPPQFFAEAMKKVNFVVTLGQVDFGHTIARKEASAAGVSYAYMPELMATDLAELAIKSKDLVEVMEFTDRLASAVSEANKVHISNRIGTDVVFDITGRRGLSLTPVFRTPGQLSVIPFYAEVACAVVEGKGSGTAVLDGTVVGLPSLNGVLNEPISWGVQKGSVVGINGGREAVKLRGLLEKLDDNAWKIGELGIGTNFKLPNRLRGTRVDNAIFGHIHLALGRNVDLGGEQWSQIHADFLCSDVKVELDGRTIIEDGRFIG